MSDQPQLFDVMTCDPADLLDKGGDALLEMRKWPQRLVELFQVMEAYNRRQKMDPEAAARDAAERVVLIADYQGGRPQYLPKSDEIRRGVRDALIFRFSGRIKVEQLADQFGLTTAMIYQIIAEQTALFRARLQGRLFDDGENP
jgi:Mor family transcriptional regulator